MEFEPSHLTKIEEIVTLLDLSEDCTIVFVLCNEPFLCDAICKEIFERVHSKIYVCYVEMNEGFADLFQLLDEARKSELYDSIIKESKKVAFFVFGLNQAVRKKNFNGKSVALLLRFLNLIQKNN